MRTKTAFALICALALAIVTPAAATAAETPQATVFGLTNDHRVTNGRAVLAAKTAMTTIAQDWAEHMASTGKLVHRADISAGLPSGWSSAGENIAYNCQATGGAEKLVAQWIASSGHNENMLNPNFTHLGVGVAKDSRGCTWGVQVFAKYNTTASGKLAFLKVGKPAISGTLRSGYYLGSSSGTWSPAPSSLKYQWLRNGVAISGATGKTYRLTTTDRGKTIALKVSAVRSGYATTSSVSAGKYIPRVFSKAPTPAISGTAKVGKTLKAVVGTWSPTPSSFSYQWYRNGVKISGATAAKYTLKSIDKGKGITVKVTGKKSGYSSVAKTSAARKVY